MAKVDVGWLWHRRLAHVNMRSLQSLLKGDHVRGLTNVSFAKDRACSACIEGKLHEKAHLPTSIIYLKRPLELLHMDLFGPPSAEVCRTVANFPQVHDLRFINPWEV